jgi:hypothetical protein
MPLQLKDLRLQPEILPLQLQVLCQSHLKALQVIQQNCATQPLRVSSSSVQSSSTPLGKEGFGPELQLPPRHWQLNGSHDGLKVRPD